ncbi:MAG: YbaB/EbfC family nucleoid-associated protein [Pirellulaceae bacterium]
MFKNLSGLAQLMRHAGSMGERVKELRATLAEAQATGSAGDGQVHVEMTGLGTVTRLRLSPELMDANDVERLEELIPAALNEAADQSASNAHREDARGDRWYRPAGAG